MERWGYMRGHANDVSFVLDEHTQLYHLVVLADWNNSPRIYNVAPLGHIILITLSPWCCVISGEQQIPILYSFVWSDRDRTQDEHANHYTDVGF